MLEYIKSYIGDHKWRLAFGYIKRRIGAKWFYYIEDLIRDKWNLDVMEALLTRHKISYQRRGDNFELGHSIRLIITAMFLTSIGAVVVEDG
jgi:hypothetical protein